MSAFAITLAQSWTPTEHAAGCRCVSLHELDICGFSLYEDFHLVLQAEAGLLGYAEKLGPHVVAHPALAMDYVTVSTAADKSHGQGLGPGGCFGSLTVPTGPPEPKMP